MRRLLAGTLAACFGVGCQQPACKCQEPRSPNAVAAGAAPSSAPLTVAPAPPSPAPPPPPGPSAEPLPEVIVKNIGLHIGGGPNDEASKAPFVRAIEARFDELRACYRKIGEPGKGGVFGVDLSIPREGGRPEVKNPRTGLSGPQFRECVIGVFSTVEFERPPRGPTVISYSVEYSLK